MFFIFKEKAGKEGATHLQAICETLQNQNFTVKRSMMDPLPIPYEYLLGFPPTRKSEHEMTSGHSSHLFIAILEHKYR